MIDEIEADCFWCFGLLLEGLQVNYTYEQPGLQRMQFKLDEIMQRVKKVISGVGCIRYYRTPKYKTKKKKGSLN